MADHRITDFVDQQAIDRLKELKDEMLDVKQAYVDTAKELLKGLEIKVKGLDDLNTVVAGLNKAQEQTIQTTVRLNNNIEAQREVLGRTTAAIAETLQEQNKLDREVRQSGVDHAKVRSILEQVNGSYDSRLQRLIKLNAEMKGNAEAMKRLEQSYKMGAISSQEYDEKMFNLTKTQRELAQEKASLTVRLKNEEREMQSVEGSYNHLSQELELLKKAYKDLTDEEKAQPFGKDMLEAINQLDTELKYQAENMGEHQRNVGDYAIAIRGGVTVIRELNEVLDMQAVSVAGCIEQNKQLERAKQNLNVTDADYEQTLERINKKIAENNDFIQKNGENHETTKSQLKDLVLEIATLTLEYRKLSDEEKASAQGREMAAHINELTERAGQLRDAIADTNAAISHAASDTRSFDQINEGIQLLVSGYGAAKGAASLLGLEEKSLIEVQTKLQAVMVVSNALKRIQTLLQKQSALMQAVNTIQTKAAATAETIRAAAVGKGTVATIAATAAQKAFNAVAKANPFVLLALGATALVGALSKLVSGGKKSAKAADEMTVKYAKLRKEMEAQAEVVKELSEIYINSYMDAVKEQREYNKSLYDYRTIMQRTGAEEVARIQILNKIARDENRARYERIAAAKEMQRLYPDYLGNFKEEAIIAGKASQHYEILSKRLIENAKNRALFELMVENQKKALNKAQEYGFDYEEEQRKFNSYADELLGDVSTKALEYGTYLHKTIRTLVSDGYEALSQKQREDLEELKGNMTDDVFGELLDRLNIYYQQAETWGNDFTNALVANFRLMRQYSPGEDLEELNSRLKQAVDSRNNYNRATLEHEKQLVDAELRTKKEGTEIWLAYKRESLDLEEQLELSSADQRYTALQKTLEEAKKNGLLNEEQYGEEIKAATTRWESEKTAISEKFAQERARIESDALVKVWQESLAKSNIESEQRYNDDLNNLKNKYAEELKSAQGNAEEQKNIREKYERDVAKLSEDFAIETAQTQIASFKKLLESSELTAEERIKIKTQLAVTEQELETAIADQAVAEAERTVEADNNMTQKRIENAQKVLQMVSQGLNALNGLASAVFDARIEKIEKEQETQDEAAQKESDRVARLVEQNVLTEEEGEARKRAAEDKTARKNEELEKKKQRLKRKQAEWDKANQLAQASINTAASILASAKMGFPAAIPFVAMAAALGAIQIATILATPIPKYAKGTENHPGGPAIVGDGGKNELVSLSGKLFITPDTPTLVDLPKGAEVYPDAELLLEKSLELHQKIDSSSDTVLHLDTTRLERKLDDTKEVLYLLLYSQKNQAKAIRDVARKNEFEKFKIERGL